MLSDRRTRFIFEAPKLLRRSNISPPFQMLSAWLRSCLSYQDLGFRAYDSGSRSNRRASHINFVSMDLSMSNSMMDVGSAFRNVSTPPNSQSRRGIRVATRRKRCPRLAETDAGDPPTDSGMLPRSRRQGRPDRPGPPGEFCEPGFRRSSAWFLRGFVVSAISTMHVGHLSGTHGSLRHSPQNFHKNCAEAHI